MHTCMFVFLNECMHVFVDEGVFSGVCMCVHVCEYVCVYVYTHMCAHVSYVLYVCSCASMCSLSGSTCEFLCLSPWQMLEH